MQDPTTMLNRAAPKDPCTKIGEHFSQTHSVHGLLLGLSEFWKSVPQLQGEMQEASGTNNEKQNLNVSSSLKSIANLFQYPDNKLVR